MDKFFIMLETIVIFFGYILIGVICAKANIIKKENKQSYIDFVLQVTLPAMILNSFNFAITKEQLYSVAVVIAFSFLTYALAFIVSRFAYTNFPDNKQPIMKYATLVNNASFMGMPLIESVYGTAGAMLASFYLIPARVFIWSAGIALFTTTDSKTKIKNILLNTCVIATVLGIVKNFLNFQYPHIIATVLYEVGRCTGPITMIIVGVILTEANLKMIFDKSLLYLSFIRLVALPLLLLLIMKLIVLPADAINVCVSLAAMPAATLTAIMSGKYGADEQYASIVVFVTTVLSLITAPLLTLFI